MKKDLNKRLRELREGNEPIKKNQIFIPEVGDIISVYGGLYQCTDKGIGTFFLKMTTPPESTWRILI